MMNTENSASEETHATVSTFATGVLARGVVAYLSYGATISLQGRYDFPAVSLVLSFGGILAFLAAIDFAWFGFQASMRSWTTLCVAILVVITGYNFYSNFSFLAISIGLVFMSTVVIPVALGASIGCGATNVAKRFQATNRRIDPLDDKPSMNGSI